jgi:lysophospholipase L1-like esterase
MKLAVMALAWVGTWATAPEPFMPGSLETYRNETLRLIVHVSEGGSKVRVRISNAYGDKPLAIGAAHVARRSMGADIAPMSDRALLFHGQTTATVSAHDMLISDPVDLDVPALSDLAISLYLPNPTDATTSHLLALQTSYVATGDTTAATQFPFARTIDTWPFLTGVDVVAPAKPAIVVIGSSTTDGDGSTQDANARWPDVLAKRLGKDAGVLNLGIIGNRLLNDSPSATSFGRGLGESVLARYERDVLKQSGVKFIVVAIGVNQVNDWIRSTHEFDALIDFDAVLRDPQHPTRLLLKFDSGDHLHCNDAGYAATANAVPLELFRN